MLQAVVYSGLLGKVWCKSWVRWMLAFARAHPIVGLVGAKEHLAVRLMHVQLFKRPISCGEMTATLHRSPRIDQLHTKQSTDPRTTAILASMNGQPCRTLCSVHLYLCCSLDSTATCAKTPRTFSRALLPVAFNFCLQISAVLVDLIP